MAGIHQGRMQSSVLGTSRKCTLTHAFTDTAIGSTIPTSKPGSPQYSFTVDKSTHYPTIVGDTLHGMPYQAVCMFVIRRIGTTTENVTCQLYKNGVQVGSDVLISVSPINYYFTFTFLPTIVEDGDLLEAYFYETTSDNCTLVQGHCLVFANPLMNTTTKGFLKDLNILFTTCIPSIGNPGDSANKYWGIAPYGLNRQGNGILYNLTQRTTINLSVHSKTLSPDIDFNNRVGFVSLSATYYPYYSNNGIIVPSSISWVDGGSV